MIRITLNAEVEERGEDSGIVALLAIEEALVQLERLDARCGRVLHLTCFAGLSREEIAGLLGISVPTVDRELRFGRAWLNKVLAGDS